MIMLEKNPKTRNSHNSVVNRIMGEKQCRLYNKLKREGKSWQEIDKAINNLK